MPVRRSAVRAESWDISDSRLVGYVNVIETSACLLMIPIPAHEITSHEGLPPVRCLAVVERTLHDLSCHSTTSNQQGWAFFGTHHHKTKEEGHSAPADAENKKPAKIFRLGSGMLVNRSLACDAEVGSVAQVTTVSQSHIDDSRQAAVLVQSSDGAHARR